MAGECVMKCKVAETYAEQSVLGLILVQGRDVVVDQAETRALAATELGAEAEKADGGLISDVVHLGQERAQLLLADVGAARVDDIDNL
jgi:hypothetical protein